MRPTTSATRYVRAALVTAALALPTLSLIPLGGWLLWEKGWLLPWAIGAFLVVSGIALLEFRIFGGPRNVAVAASDPDDGGDLPEGDAAWSANERRAWSDVLVVARRVDVDKLDEPKAFADLAVRTIETVAHRLHAEKADPVWQFTMPEALAISERVSRRLAEFVETHIPFGDRLTLAQVRAAYRWRGAFEMAERAYDVWRVLRLANPATAVTNEARDRLSRALVSWGREQLTRRFAESFVEEVGRAAIDLYGGRLGSSTPQQLVARSERIGEVVDSFPYRIVVTGQTVASCDAMAELIRIAVPVAAEASRPHRVVVESMPIDVVTRHPAGGSEADAISRLAAADVLVWVEAHMNVRVPADDDNLGRVVAAAADWAGNLPPIIVPLIDGGTEAVGKRAVEQLTGAMARLRKAQLDGRPTVMPVVTLQSHRDDAAASVSGALTAALTVARERRVAAIIGHGEAAPPGRVRQAASATGRIARSLLWRPPQRT